VSLATLLHAGWFNAGLATLAIWGMWRQRRAPFIVFGIGAIAFAIVACGLLAPDPRTVVGAPGTSVHVDEIGGALVFPPAGAGNAVRGTRITLDAVLRNVPRTVVAIEATDLRGAHLTITQPTGSAFLSPVLLMQGTQAIAGIDVPFDSFAVPPAHRIVKAVLLTGAQAAAIPRVAAAGGSAVIFDLEDDTGASIPHGIGVAANGERIVIDGLGLRPAIFSYGAVSVTAIPNLAVVALGVLSLLAGGLLTKRRARG
jgi:hypothetical protein